MINMTIQFNMDMQGNEDIHEISGRIDQWVIDLGQGKHLGHFRVCAAEIDSSDSVLETDIMKRL